MSKLISFQQNFELVHPVVGNERNLMSLMLGGKVMEASIWFLASLVRNEL